MRTSTFLSSSVIPAWTFKKNSLLVTLSLSIFNDDIYGPLLLGYSCMVASVACVDN